MHETSQLASAATATAPFDDSSCLGVVTAGALCGRRRRTIGTAIQGDDETCICKWMKMGTYELSDMRGVENAS